MGETDSHLSNDPEMLNPERLERAYQTALAALLAERTPEGHWVGELSTSALSTATAVSALALVGRHDPSAAPHDDLIVGGAAWLATHQNADGGWGDTVKSFSNISTTMLCRAAFHITGTAARHADSLRRADAYMNERYGTTPEEHAEAVRCRYGKDRTFSVPILMTSALAGLVSWREVPPLPFELACFPQSLFRFLRLPVVSYALPALIAIGQAVHHHRGSWNPFRRLAINKSLRVLHAIQPSSGGYLEATPLTSFVTMGLASVGRADHPVARHAVEFLVKSVLPDGSWPIDTNLATWVTTLSINALAAAGELESLENREAVREWLLKQQYRERHLYTGADPGAWAWTDLPGGVPDADDTPGAVLALMHLGARLLEPPHALGKGIVWLLRLQNRDGGWPTFCRGWGYLPFDRSGPDLTAHALRAIDVVLQALLTLPDRRYAAEHYRRARARGLGYLAATQRPGGSWLPLWFGCQHAPDDENPTYGTARVLAAYRDLDMMVSEPARRGVAWLLSAQNADGGWGGAANTPSSIEETALAVEVLVDVPTPAPSASEGSAPSLALGAGKAVERGLIWLIERIEAGGLREPTPIGFYFAKLWYYEKLYPIIFSVAALGRARRRLPGSIP
jgi:squalene-hopene/tetraprenyl-beta-curcumene cyclase